MSSTDWKRIRSVASVLGKQGLGMVFHSFSSSWYLPWQKKSSGYSTHSVKKEFPIRLRKAMEELGGTYVKLGQMLSLREDLIPREYADEFKKLLDEVKQLPFSQIKKIVESETKKPLEDAFSSFEKKPLGSASIAQVHKAILKNGMSVVVKVKRPNSDEIFASDIHVLYYFARKLESRFKEHFSPLRVVQEFERYTMKELNLLQEAQYITRFRETTHKSFHVSIPKVFWQYSSKCVLVLEYLPGKKLSHITHKKNTALAKKLADHFTSQVFETGIFHGDLHPGNILVMPRGRVGLIDFGIVGILTTSARIEGYHLWNALEKQDLDEIIRSLESLGFPSKDTNYDQLRKDSYIAMREWSSPRSKHISYVLRLLFASCKRNNLPLPGDVILLAKGFLTIEGTCLQLDPSFNLFEYAKNKVNQLEKSPRRIGATARAAIERTKSMAEVLYQLPAETLSVLDRLKHGKVELNMEDTDVRHLGMDINKSSNRLSFALIVSALTITGALTISMGPLAYGISYISLFFFIIAIFFMIPLIVSIKREGSLTFDPHKKI